MARPTPTRRLSSARSVPLYELTVEAAGFRKSVVGNIKLLTGATLRQTVRLERGQVSESISIEANAIQVNTADAQAARSIAMRDIDTLPQLGRSPLALAALNTGVSVDAGDQSFSRVNGLRGGSELAQFAFAPAGSIGSSGRNNFCGASSYNFAVSLVKRIPIAERLKLGYRLELFNALNHANFDNHNNVYSTPNPFSRITALVNRSSGNGTRVMQMALRLDF